MYDFMHLMRHAAQTPITEAAKLPATGRAAEAAGVGFTKIFSGDRGQGAALAPDGRPLPEEGGMIAPRSGAAPIALAAATQRWFDGVASNGVEGAGADIPVETPRPAPALQPALPEQPAAGEGVDVALQARAGLAIQEGGDDARQAPARVQAATSQAPDAEMKPGQAAEAAHSTGLAQNNAHPTRQSFPEAPQAPHGPTDAPKAPLARPVHVHENRTGDVAIQPASMSSEMPENAPHPVHAIRPDSEDVTPVSVDEKASDPATARPTDMASTTAVASLLPDAPSLQPGQVGPLISEAPKVESGRATPEQGEAPMAPRPAPTPSSFPDAAEVRAPEHAPVLVRPQAAETPRAASVFESPSPRNVAPQPAILRVADGPESTAPVIARGTPANTPRGFEAAAPEVPAAGHTVRPEAAEAARPNPSAAAALAPQTGYAEAAPRTGEPSGGVRSITAPGVTREAIAPAPVVSLTEVEPAPLRAEATTQRVESPPPPLARPTARPDTTGPALPGHGPRAMEPEIAPLQTSAAAPRTQHHGAPAPAAAPIEVNRSTPSAPLVATFDTAPKEVRPSVVSGESRMIPEASAIAPRPRGVAVDIPPQPAPLIAERSQGAERVAPVAAASASPKTTEAPSLQVDAKPVQGALEPLAQEAALERADARRDRFEGVTTERIGPTRAAPEQMNIATPQPAAMAVAPQAVAPEVDLAALAEADSALEPLIQTGGSLRMEALAHTAAASTGSAPGQQAQGAHVAQQLAAAIRMEPGTRSFEIRLDPPELGKVDIDVTVENNQVNVVVRAEREDALDLMRRHAEDLTRMLRESGLTLGSLDFGQREEGQGGDDSKGQGYAAADPDSPTALAAEAMRAQARYAAEQSGGVDIRA